ncbi:MAG: NAD-dependent malic enzyme [Fibrobacteres bacterium]|jgi:malate dehydrogenase (oxaloacetate-decarboxylating)|nr:NAD-dependent malic enzyme [Fibrobacterota bacterium]
MKPHPTSSSNAITLRVKLSNHPGILGRLTAAIGEAEGNIGAVDIVRREGEFLIRDLTVETAGPDHADAIAARVREIEGIQLMQVSDRTFLLHLGGKISVTSKIPLKTRDELSMAYTPGVARVCMAIHDKPDAAYNLTIKRNAVAVVSDGSAVLGLGNLGPLAAMPVMEGKAMLFKTFGGVDAYPICLDTQDPERIIDAVRAIAPGFGGINLEDISAPRCFQIEKALRASLDIPVFHDDQHGTAVVLTAAFLNALAVTGKKAEDLKVVVLGVGAAGTACSLMLHKVGVRNLIGCDRQGAIYRGRANLSPDKAEFAEWTNPDDEKGNISELLAGADVFIGLSGPNLITLADLKSMRKDPFVFAMSNPDPEIDPEEALKVASVVATGRSDFPNQVNNVLCFPGIFRGALDCRARDINEEMKMAAARAIAEVIPRASLQTDYVIPSVFDANVVPAVAKAVIRAAQETGVARRVIENAE